MLGGVIARGREMGIPARHRPADGDEPPALFLQVLGRAPGFLGAFWVARPDGERHALVTVRKAEHQLATAAETLAHAEGLICRQYEATALAVQCFEVPD